jgi:hypothetical protein
VRFFWRRAAVPAAQDEHKDWSGDEYVPAAQDKHVLIDVLLVDGLPSGGGTRRRLAAGWLGVRRRRRRLARRDGGHLYGHCRVQQENLLGKWPPLVLA